MFAISESLNQPTVGTLDPSSIPQSEFSFFYCTAAVELKPVLNLLTEVLWAF